MSNIVRTFTEKNNHFHWLETWINGVFSGNRYVSPIHVSRNNLTTLQEFKENLKKLNIDFKDEKD